MSIQHILQLLDEKIVALQQAKQHLQKAVDLDNTLVEGAGTRPVENHDSDGTSPPIKRVPRKNKKQSLAMKKSWARRKQAEEQHQAAAT